MTNQMSSCTSLMPTACPAKTWLKLIFLLPRQMRPASSDHDGFVVERIVDVRQSRVGTRGRLVDLRRTFHVQSLVRPFVVKDLHKLVEASLLLKEVRSRGLSGFFLQGKMHAFLTAILLGRTWLDPLDTDPQAQPPNGELAQVE